MKPARYLPNPTPVEALQYTGDNWGDVEAFIGPGLLRAINRGEQSKHCIFLEWSCDLHPTDWIVKTPDENCIIVDDDGFGKSYNPA